MAVLMKNGIPYGNSNTLVEFEELSYADYKAGNYDPTKSYAIPDFPSNSNKKMYWNLATASLNGETSVTVTDKELANYDYVSACFQNWGQPIKYIEYASGSTSFTIHMSAAVTGGVEILYTAIKM